MKPIQIGARMIEPFGPVLVIAEIGVNHDGSLARAIELVESAAACGADAIKLQVFRARALMNPACSFAEYQKPRCDDPDPAAMLARYELGDRELRGVCDAARKLGLLPIATPFSLDDVDRLLPLDLAAIKIASPDLVNQPLLHKAASLGKPLLISTGASTIEEVETTVKWLRDWEATFLLMHCISSYPTQAEAANLCWIDELSSRFDLQAGYSDHTTDVYSGALAVTAGACLIERHLTYDRGAAGPDHAASSDATEFAEYVRLIRAAQRLRGAPGKHVLPSEQDVRRVSRQSLVAARSLDAGELIRQDDLIIQRPGIGIPAAMLASAVGRRAARSICAGDLLQWDMLSDAA